MIHRICFLAALLLLVTAELAANDSVEQSLRKISQWSETDTVSAGPLSLAEERELVESLRAMPDGAQLRLRSSALARDLLKQAYLADSDKPKRRKAIYFAWSLLVGGNVLRDGLAPEQVVAILGTPSRTDDHGDLVWIADDEAPGPRLTAQLDESGKTLAFSTSFGGQ